MTDEVEIRHLEDLVHVSRALRAAGTEGKGLRRELYSGLNRATKPVRAEMKAAIPGALPASGGLAADVQRTTRFATTTRTGGSSVGVRIRARGKRSIRRMNSTGTFRHPVFGNRSVWVTQSAGVEKGFLDRPFEKARPVVRAEVMATIARVRANIYRSI
jgi:hypothetical protein